MKIIRIGLIGFGTIGQGVYRGITQNAALIRERTGIDLAITMVCDNRPEALKEIKGAVTTDSWKKIVEASDIDVVVELIGGIDPAKDIIVNSLKNGKSVVSANKKLFAEKSDDIFATALSSPGSLKFEAAVGGGIPCLLALSTGMVANNIRSIMGILNGTTNYILTQMEDKGLPFSEILKDAQKKGFAEADPTFDIEGFDAGHKISLLAMLAYNRKIDFKKIPIEGISKITDIDIAFARDMGYVIRLLGIARLAGDAMDISVHPTMIPLRHPLASVRNEFNAVMFDGDMTDPITLHGKGAGSAPTASAVISDIIQIAENRTASYIPHALDGDTRYLDPSERRSKYYLRIHSKDAPGILSKISGVLGSHNISIASVIQKETDEEYVPLIIMTHDVDEASVLLAAREIGDFDFIAKEVMILRVED